MRLKLKEYRAKNNMTQEQLALAAGCSRQFISTLEQEDADVNISSKLLLSIAQALNCKVDDLFFWEESPLQ